MKQRWYVVEHADDGGRRAGSYSARNTGVVGGLRLRGSLGLDENYEFSEFTETVNVGFCREFWRLP